MTTMVINGWEYLTEITPDKLPSEQKIQTNYLCEYNMAYHKFLTEICLSEEELNNIKKISLSETKYKFIIDLSEENDIINNNNEYPIKFLKSKFILFKLKKLKKDLIEYYKPRGFFIKGPFELITNKKIKKYYIELYWQNNTN